MIDKEKEKERKRRWWHNHKASSKPSSFQAPSLSHKSHIPISASSKLKLRLHRFQRTYKITSALSQERLRSLRINKLNNNIQYLGSGFRITTQNLELEGLELISDSTLPVAVLEGLAIATADRIAERLSALYGFTIAKEGITPPSLTEIELAEVEITKRLNKRGIIPLKWDEKGNVVVWSDWSFGLAGWESNNPLYQQRLTDITNDVADGYWEQMKLNQFKVWETFNKVAQNEFTHIPLIQEAKDTLHANNELMQVFIPLLKEYIKLKSLDDDEAPQRAYHGYDVSLIEALADRLKDIFKRFFK